MKKEFQRNKNMQRRDREGWRRKSRNIFKEKEEQWKSKNSRERERIDGRIKVNKSDLEWRTNWSGHNEARVARMHATSESIRSQKSMHCVHSGYGHVAVHAN